MEENMSEIGGRHYMNPAYGRAIATEAEDDGEECADHGDLKHISVHPQKGGGFSVHAHYQHRRAGHHSVESRHASHEEAAEEVKRHLRGHDVRQAQRSGRAEEEESEDAS
jgi:hypothetical protein